MAAQLCYLSAASHHRANAPALHSLSKASLAQVWSPGVPMSLSACMPFLAKCLIAEPLPHDSLPDMQGFASTAATVAQGSTLWGAAHSPQNRELFMLSAGDGSVHLFKYHYPDKRHATFCVLSICT